MLSDNPRSTGKGRSGIGAARASAVVAALAVALLLAPCAAAAPATRTGGVRIAFSKNALWYQPGEEARLTVILDNENDVALKGVDVRLRVHARMADRAELDETLDGSPGSSYKQSETLGRNLTLEPGNNEFSFGIELDRRRYRDGVYPLTLQALEGTSVLSSASSELVLFSTKDDPEIVPLRLSIVFETLEPPHRGADGLFEGDKLAAECDPTGREPGWYPTLLDSVENARDFNSTFSLSPMLVGEVLDMTDGYSVKVGDAVQRRSAESPQARNAASVLSSFRRLTQNPRVQVLPAPYSSPDLETLVGLNWAGDARRQMSAGRKGLEEDLETTLDRQYFCPPGRAMNSRVLRTLGREAGSRLLITSAALERNREGRRLARGNTLCQPVVVSGSPAAGRTLALFEDARLHRLFQLVSQSGDAHGVAQVVLAELTNLYLEQPDKSRVCAVAWPSRWRPTREVLDEVIRALTTAPWLKTASLAESMDAVPALQNDPLEIPQPSMDGNDYFIQVARARQRYRSFSAMVTRSNPLLPGLERNLAVSQSDVWREWDRKVDGLTYASSVIRTVDREVDKVEFPALGSITLTSHSAKIPLSVVNGTSYRIVATLKLASNGLTFPDGRVRKVTLEPKENVLEIPVKAKKKGRVRFQARLETRDFILGEVDFTVLTSRFNTFAVAVVGGLLGIIGAFWIAKTVSRRKVGKHKRGNLSGTEERQEGQGSEA